MPNDLFGDVARGPRQLGSRRWYTVPLSIATHGAAVAAILVIPLLAPDAMPQVRRATSFTDIVLKPPAPPRGSPPRAAAPAPRRAAAGAPIEAPPAIGPERQLPLVDDMAATPGGDPNGVPGGLPVASEEWTPPPPLVEPPKGPLRISRGMRPPQKVVHVNPTYPAVALSARVQGTVVIDAVIGPTGRIEQARIVKSEPLLDAAALAAVRQWRYTPTLLNNTPVSVILTVSVTFRIP